ncbi:lysozyme inhibitor LprI family protein [Candidatus Glomeribacter gigasporarum]|nr:lysozyme inhibitor LprI family protein [Candidatus Glomeribacter gigasporarum]
MPTLLLCSAVLCNAAWANESQPEQKRAHFSVDLPLVRARRQYGDRCGRSRSPSRSDGGDPAASSYGEREATPGKSLKNALEPKDCMETARNQAEMTQCAASKARAPDRELNQLYLDIRKQYRDDPVFLNALRRAQRAWIRFRETQIKMKYPEAPDAYGSSFSMCRNGYLEALTRARTATLKEWQSGAEEGDVCAGSIRHQAAENAGEEKAKSR